MNEDSLSTFVESVCGDSHLRIEDDFGGGFVRLRTSEAERRQAAHDIRSSEDIVIEMLRNARDAHASHIFLATGKEGSLRRIIMLDDGDGIPFAMHERVFEPRVTSKLDSVHMDKWGIHGRGMALYSIAVNATSARIVTSAERLGSSFSIESDTTRLSEKADQSSFPLFELQEGERVSVRGPKNIVRTACEFALESRKQCSVFLGSVTDIAATLYQFGMATVPRATRAFSHSSAAFPVCKRLALATDPESFAQEAAAIGLSLSERSARRIIDGQIEALDPLLDRIALASGMKPSDEPLVIPRRKKAQAQAIKLSAEDQQELTSHIKRLFGDVARKYYLEEDVEPKVTVSKGQLKISIPLERGL